MARRALLTLLAGVALAAGLPAAAQAAACAQTLVDPAGHSWDILQGGAVFDGDFDAYDRMGDAFVANNGTSAEGPYVNASASGCVTEDGGREIVFPLDTNVDNQGVDLVRKVYVPASRPAFARWLDILTNPTATTKTITFEWYGHYGTIDTPGVRDTTDGDLEVDIGERWAVLIHDGDEGFGTEVASFWDGPGGDGWDRAYDDAEFKIPGDDNEDEVAFMYDDVSIPPGGMAVMMHVEHQSQALADAAVFARRYGDGPDAFFAGMSAAELGALRNWRPPAPVEEPPDETEEPPGTIPEPTPPATGPPVPPAPPPAGRPLRVHPQRLALKVVRKRTRLRTTLTVTGRVVLPAGVAAEDGCRGSVLVKLRTASALLRARLIELRPDCTFRSSDVLRRDRSVRRWPLVVTASFSGNARLKRGVSRTVAAGRG